MNIKLWLDLNVASRFNDASTRELLANSFGVICTEAENTPDVIEKNALRFIKDSTLYEYTYDDTIRDTTIVVIPR
jgi:hypothetical protein